MVDRKECTMQLNLTVMGPKQATAENYKKWTVLHEAGHALGFGHEHQHPDHPDLFDEGAIIKYLTDEVFYDEEKATRFYNINYKYVEASKDTIVRPFDKDSVSMLIFLLTRPSGIRQANMHIQIECDQTT